MDNGENLSRRCAVEAIAADWAGASDFARHAL